MPCLQPWISTLFGIAFAYGKRLRDQNIFDLDEVLNTPTVQRFPRAMIVEVYDVHVCVTPSAKYF